MNFFEAHEYQEKVNNIYTKLSERIKKALPEARVEHIGSSAIAGAVSKGDLDVYVGVNQSDFDASVSKIKGLGFVEKKGTLRTESLCMLVTDEYDHDVAIQLVANGSEFENFLHFKTMLQGDAALLSEYNELKRSSTHLSETEYRARKSRWLEEVLLRARKK